MKRSGLLVMVTSCWLAAPTAAQPVHKIAFEWDISQSALKQEIDACVAASADRVVVATNQQIVLLTTAGVQMDSKKWDEAGYPFQSTLLVDPRVDYDRHSGRLWMVIVGSGGKIHIAVSKDSSPDTFSSADWHIYTGSNAFDLADTDIVGTHYVGGADHPAISFDSNAMWLTSIDFKAPPNPVVRQGVIVFPRSHTGGSILEGQKPPYSVLEGISPATLNPADNSRYHYSVQEPFEDVEEGQFFIATPKDPVGYAVGVQDGVRLGGAYHDGSGNLQYQWVDMDVPAAADLYFNAGITYQSTPFRPATPDQNWEILTLSSKFDSGVLARDSNNALKVFAGHNVIATNQSQGPILPVDRTEFRYYVIDPDLANFPGPNWNPHIEVAGVAPTNSITGGETHQGAISVNEHGDAYLTFTRSGTSDPSGWPSLVQTRLSANYTSPLYNYRVEAGPDQTYADSNGPLEVLGLDYADIEPDPDHCGFWAVGAIAAFADAEPEPPATTSARAVWVSEILVSCDTNGEMNGDGAVDELDLALYMEYHAKGDQRADMDRSGTITAADYEIYAGKYAKR